MAPQISLLSLLQQCFIVPSCRASSLARRQSLSSRRAFYSSRPHHRRPRLDIIAHPRNEHSRSISTEGRGEGQQTDTPQQRIAVLGGGITGLSAAHYLSRELPDAQITIFEGGKRLGGWLNSEQVNIGNGYITVEQGPRTLRGGTPAALPTLEIVCTCDHA